MAKEQIALLVSDPASRLLAPVREHLKTLEWAPNAAEPLCLVCEEVDFSGALALVHVVAKDPERAPFPVWLPYHSIQLAFDFSDYDQEIGFLAELAKRSSSNP
jgi:hypothetical protein